MSDGTAAAGAGLTPQIDRPIDSPIDRAVVREVGLRAVMRDGTELVADAWYPDPSRRATGDPDRWPVLLQRLPYGRSVASTPVLAHPSWFARHGYAVVVQDCRGRGDSGGTFSPFVHEASDGFDSIQWAATLPFANGEVATYGFSYQGLAQLYAAAEQPSALRAIAPMMCCPDPYEGWTYEGGTRRWPFVCFWAAQLRSQERGAGPIRFDVDALPIGDALGDDPPRWFVEWLMHEDGDEPYWHERRPNIEAIDVPAFTVLGWFDDFSSGTAQLAHRLAARVPVEMIAGPWAHMPWSSTVASPALVNAALVSFFDRVLQRGEVLRPSTRYFVVGEPDPDGWRATSSWPPPETSMLRFQADSDGNANGRYGDGRLLVDRQSSAPAADRRALGDVLVVEPLVPYRGDDPDRRDVCCYFTEPLTSTAVIVGTPTLEVSARCDRASHDLVASLVLVKPDGRSTEMTRAIRRSFGGDATHHLTMRPIAWRVDVGDRLRLDVSGAHFPSFDRNLHTGSGSATLGRDDALVATIELGEIGLEIPVLPSSAGTMFGGEDQQ